MDMQSQDISFEYQNTTRPAYLALPAGRKKAPGIVVIHEAYGLNDNIRDIARRFAREGYAALAVDMFGGRNRVVCMFRYMGAMLQGKLDHSGISELKAALTFLAGHPSVDPERLGAIGFCMGGGFAITWACTDPRLKVIAPFYGMAPRPVDAVARSCPVVGSYPQNDFTASTARALDKTLTRHNITHDIKIYEGARHSFFNDTGPRYHPQAAADAWDRTLAFFKQQLEAA